jgi:hypothetical protein
VKCLRIISADSSAALLNHKFEPQQIIAAAAVLVEPPYRDSNNCIAEPINLDAEKGHEAVIREAELCVELLRLTKADVVHLDMSLGGISIEQLSPIQFSKLRVSSRAKRHLIRILPRIRKISGEAIQRHGVEVIAIGKESIPVRIAELTAGAHAVLYSCEESLKKKKPVLLGLPTKCELMSTKKMACLHSLVAGEHDVRGHAQDKKGILEDVRITQLLNPCARGFRALEISPK